MKSVLVECTNVLGRGLDRFPWADKNAYGDWIAQTYYYVRHSTRLLAAAAARFPFDERGIALHLRFAAHMAEEKKHELLCVHDLKVLGLTLADFTEHASTRMFYEPQYYKIEHQDPLALFGYILPLEAIGPWHAARVIEAITKAHGEKSAQFMKLHSEEDVEHLDKALQMLEGCSPKEKALVEENMQQTTYAYVAMLEDIRRLRDAASGSAR
jgi:hypothetical protein